MHTEITKSYSTNLKPVLSIGSWQRVLANPSFGIPYRNIHSVMDVDPCLGWVYSPHIPWDVTQLDRNVQEDCDCRYPHVFFSNLVQQPPFSPKGISITLIGPIFIFFRWPFIDIPQDGVRMSSPCA